MLLASVVATRSGVCLGGEEPGMWDKKWNLQAWRDGDGYLQRVIESTCFCCRMLEVKQAMCGR
jgi:hypothetical protein